MASKKKQKSEVGLPWVDGINPYVGPERHAEILRTRAARAAELELKRVNEEPQEETNGPT